MQDWDLLLTDASIATMSAGGAAYGIIEDAAVAVVDGKIAWPICRQQMPGKRYQ
jgi:imidazolonepropionase